jgi:ATP-dependent helicase/nuclease subunit A
MQQKNILSDQSVRLQALDIHQSCILQAPAGSGKTKLVIDRFLKVLTTVGQPEQVLAITFTRKAAFEMRDRMQQALLYPDKLPIDTQALVSDLLKKDAALHWGLTQNIHRFQILTIDAFAHSLLSKFPQHGEVDAGVNLTENADYYYRRAIQQLWLHAHDLNQHRQYQLNTLLSFFKNRIDRLNKLLLEVLQCREQWLYPVVSHHRNTAYLKQRVEMSLQHLALDAMQQAEEVFPDTLKKEFWSIFTWAMQQLSPCDDSIYPMNFPGIEEQDIHTWKKMSTFLLTKTGAFRKRVDKTMGFLLSSMDEAGKHQKKKLQSILCELRSNTVLASRLHHVMHLPAVEYDVPQWNIIEALIEVLPVLTAELKLVFQQYQVIDFTEVSLAALQSLGTPGEPTDLALYLDHQIKHILVDEFQDTSPIHFHLLEKLTAGWQYDDGKTLFLVGDPMQSIYGFRQAEVSLFLKVQQQGLGQIPIESLQLETNFRSHPAVIEWINQHFPSIFPLQDDLRTSAVKYAAFTPAIADDVSHRKGVYYHAFSDDDLSGELNRIVELIQQYQTENPKNSIAILVRSRRQVIPVLSYLDQHDVLYQAADLQSFGKNLVIQDLMTVLQALLLPHDRLSWLALLRTPFCGILLEDLLVIVQHTDQKKGVMIWDTLLQFESLDLSADAKIRLGRIVPILKATIQKRYQYSIDRWVRMTWLSLGGALTLKNKTDAENVQQWFDILASVAAGSGVFSLEELKSTIESRYITTGSAHCCLYVMTIHKAKGLEFDHVILPELQQRLPYHREKLLQVIYQPRPASVDDIIIAPMADPKQPALLNRYVKQLQEEKLWHESVRLFYVAVTRAKKSVDLMARLTVKAGKADCPRGKSFLAMFWALVETPFTRTLSAHTAKALHHSNSPYQRLALTCFQNTDDATDTAYRLFSDYWQQSTVSVENQSTFSKWQPYHESARVLGIVFHEILQQMGHEGIEQWSVDRWQKERTFYEKRLQQSHLPAEAIKQAVETIDISVQQLLVNQTAQWILSSRHQDARQEYALSCYLDQKWVNVILDRTFIDDNIRWIIDYKTASILDSADMRLDEYRRQLALYALKGTSIF